VTRARVGGSSGRKNNVFALSRPDRSVFHHIATSSVVSRAMSRRVDADDDKYAKASARAFASPPATRAHRETMYDARDVEPRSVSARATPARDAAAARDGGRPNRLNFDEDDVRGALDRLAFSNAVNQVTGAFSEVLDDASEEIGTYASKASEALVRFQAAQHASQWNPIESGVSMRPTYVKVPVQTVDQLKFWENDDVRAMKMAHLQEKQQILSENAGLRALMGEEASDTVQEVRETEDGVNRALLLAAVEEITTLKTRVAVLESEAARHKVNQSGYGGIASMLGGGGTGVDAAQMQKLTRELARLEEDNSRMTWMLGEKEKQIKEVRAKYTESAAYALREQLQECMEALEVASNLQGEQLQYLERHALSKLEELDDQMCDVQLIAESKTEHLAQLRTVMKRFFVDGDESSVNVLTSLTGFAANEGRQLVEARQSRSISGFLSMIGSRLSPAVNAASSMIVACAPPATTSSEDALKTLGVEDDGETANESKDEDDEPTTPPAKEEATKESEDVEDAAKKPVEESAPPAKSDDAAKEKKLDPPVPERRRATRAAKKKTAGFAGFEDPSLLEKEQAERAKKRQPLPQPKLKGKAAERERAQRAQPHVSEGFAGFGDDPDASSDDE
jgi:hypothetical protein